MPVLWKTYRISLLMMYSVFYLTIFLVLFDVTGLITYLASGQTGKQGDELDSDKKFTIVTSLLDLQRDDWRHFKRTFDDYLNFGLPLLRMDVNLVLYVDERGRGFIERERKDKPHMTELNVITLEDLEYFKDYPKIREIMKSEYFLKNHPLLHHPEGFSPEYNVMMNSKLALVYYTAVRNPFNTTHFYWLDIGYGHGNDIYPKKTGWAPKNIMDDSNKITYIMLHNVSMVEEIHDIYKKFITPLVNGGFFGGTKAALSKYHNLQIEVFHHFMDSNMMDDDQTVVVECYLRNPSLFNMVLGGWYDVFKLFH